MTETDKLGRRVIDLESRHAYHTETIQDLSDTMARQWDAIDQLKRRLDRLEAELERGPALPPDAPPPHY